MTALVVAVLGWTPLGEAARDVVFPVNSVGTPQLKANAVTGPKIRNGAVAGIDIRKRTIENAHIKPGTLLASSFRPGQLPANSGVAWVSGRGGIRGATSPVNSEDKLVAARCPAGEQAVSGGGLVTAVSGVSVGLVRSGPLDEQGTAWAVAAQEFVPTGRSWAVTAIAICAKTR